MPPTNSETDRACYDQTNWDAYFHPEILLTITFPGQIPPKKIQFQRTRAGRSPIDFDSYEVDSLDKVGFEHLDFSGWSDEAIANTCYPGFLAPNLVREARGRLLQEFQAKNPPRRVYNPNTKYSPPPSMPNHWYLADHWLAMSNQELLPPEESTLEARQRRKRAYEDHIYKSNPDVYGFGQGTPEDEQNNPEFWADL